jgi:hypothetical protein
LFNVGKALGESEKYKDTFTCVGGKFAMKYLGIPAIVPG